MADLPTFLIIGAGKSGTTAVHHFCDQHPEVFMTPVKETNFFELEGKPVSSDPKADPERLYHYPQSINEWGAYQNLFADTGSYKVRGETSPMYLYGKRAPYHIQERLPDAKLIVILREPVSRLYSRFLHLLRDGHAPSEQFEEALDRSSIWWRRNDLVQEGFYYTHLKRYVDLFPPEQLNVYLYEDLKQDPHALMRDLFTFIGVDPGFQPELNVEYNVSGRPKNPLVDKLIGANSIVLRSVRSVAPGLVDQLKAQTRLQRKLTNLRKANLDREPLDKALHQRFVNEVYREEIEALQTLIHRDLSRWLTITRT